MKIQPRRRSEINDASFKCIKIWNEEGGSKQRRCQGVDENNFSNTKDRYFRLPCMCYWHNEEVFCPSLPFRGIQSFHIHVYAQPIYYHNYVLFSFLESLIVYSKNLKQPFVKSNVTSAVLKILVIDDMEEKRYLSFRRCLMSLMKVLSNLN